MAAPFSPSEMDTMLGYFGDNLDVKGDGGVAASPTTVNPDYYYHWQRDGAISMREYMTTTTMSGAQNLVSTYAYALPRTAVLTPRLPDGNLCGLGAQSSVRV